MKKQNPINLEKTQRKIFKILKVIPWLTVCLLCLFQFSEISAQRIVLDIRDAETLRPLADVEVTIRSFSTSMTQFSSPDGSVIANVPQGAYTLTLNRVGFEEQVVDNVTTTRDQITRLEILMSRERERGRESTLIKTDMDRSLFFDLGMQFGNLGSGNIGIGYYLLPNAYLLLNYSFSRRDYNSLFFSDPDENYSVSFNRINLRTGLEYGFPLINDISLQVEPNINLGLEMAGNKEFINDERINTLMNPFLSAGIDIGLNYWKATFYIGMNYAFWLTGAMNQEFNPLENGNTGEPARWSKDLFHNRKGAGIRTGIKFYL